MQDKLDKIIEQQAQVIAMLDRMQVNAAPPAIGVAEVDALLNVCNNDAELAIDILNARRRTRKNFTAGRGE